MKEASGEFSMTLVVIVGAIAVIGIIGFLTKENGAIQKWIQDQWDQISVGDYTP